VPFKVLRGSKRCHPKNRAKLTGIPIVPNPTNPIALGSNVAVDSGMAEGQGDSYRAEASSWAKNADEEEVKGS
jgi:hypothetical protein